MSDTCKDCGQPVVRSRKAIYNVNAADGLLHRQSCTNPQPITATETEASVRRQLRL